MKSKLCIAVIALSALCQYNSNAQTNKSLSNLTAPTAVNQSLLPNTSNTIDLGSDLLAWRNIYASGRLYLNKQITLHATGTSNIFVGAKAGSTGITGNNNTGIGAYALGKLSGGINNTASGYSALYNNTSGRDNVANGHFSIYLNTTGSYNSAAGTWSLYNNVSGNNNTAYGYSALWQNQTGNDNTALGKYVMYSNTRGYSNVAIGTMALFKSVRNNNTVAIGDSALYNFTGDQFSNESYTTAIGSKAMFNTISGYQNTAIGTRALYNNTKGSINTAIGVSALYSNTEGVFNTAMGVAAMSSNTTGQYNTGIGYSALQINKTGIQNTALGAYSGPNSFDLVSNSTSIGYLARATASNQVRLGNTAVTSIGGQVGWTTFSDGRYKRDIKEDVPGLAFINALKPITYTVDTRNLHAHLNKNSGIQNNKIRSNDDNISDRSIDEAGKVIHDGFVAQDVEAAARKLNFEFSGVDKPTTKDGLYGLRYDNFVVPLVKAVQELSKQNELLEQRIEQLEILLSTHGAGNNKLIPVNSIPGASLEQNTPNPFSNTTAVNYILPAKYNSAQIFITDMSGKTIRQITLSGTGKGIVHIDASALAPGSYTCSLLVDNKPAGSRKMLLVR